MSEALEIRDYRPADEPAVWALHKAASTAVEAFVDPVGIGSGVPTDPSVHAAESRRLVRDGVVLVGEIGDPSVIVGSGALDLADGESVELTRMRVHPDHWRQGFGQRLLDELERRAIDHGVYSIELETLSRQSAARALYESNEYVEVDTDDVGPFEIVTYRKSLTTE